MNVRLVAVLWKQGVWEALQLQRCVVLFVLDSSGRVLALFSKCLVVNGLIYLGSIVLHHYATKPATQWLLETYAEPVYGHAAVAVWQQLLWLLFQLLWLVPLYGISLMVSCIWYQQIATAAVEVHQRQQQAVAAGLQQAAAQHETPQQLQQKPAPAVAGGGSSMMQVLEGTAQEVFRVLLFMVFTVEVFIASLLPVVGPVLNVLLLSWLYSYYCYDYKWSLQGARLPQRLAYFEANWAFFAGFGFPCVAATVFFPGHIGAALANLLFPVFIMVACGSDPAAAQGSVMQQLSPDRAKLDSIPIFKPALWPTYWITKRLFSSKNRTA